MTITVKDIVEAYITEAKNYDFFSDPQRAYLQDDGKIVVCLRNYNWYITKEPIKDVLECFKALIEIDFICEYDEEDSFERIKFSKYWESCNV